MLMKNNKSTHLIRAKLSIVLQGDKIPDELPDELQPDKVPKPLSALPSLNGTTPKVSNAVFTLVLFLYSKILHER